MPLALHRDALGIGLRPALHADLLSCERGPDYLEAISENFLGAAALPRRRLAELRQRYPIVLHGVGLNLLGHAPPDARYLDRLCRLADDLDAPFVTDHLCWTGSHAQSHHDLLPIPYVPALVELAAERAHAVQARLGRPFGLENLSSYVTFRESTLSEWEFHSAVVRESGCFWLLDINNVYVSSVNHGTDPLQYLRAVDFSRVLQVHLAGHTREPAGNLIDTHDHPVDPAVLRLYAEAWRLGGPFPTLLERDDHIPPLCALQTELAQAREARG